MSLDQSYKSAALFLRGKTIIFGNKAAVVLKVQGFPRTENEPYPYTPILTMKPGEVFCPRFRGGLLFLVACRDGQGPGGCVLVRSVQLDEGVINGPGRVCEALGITDEGSKGKISVRNDRLTLHL